MNNYRNLTEKEIATLTVYGCSADDWKEVQVIDAFSPAYISNVHFSGHVFLGTYSSVFDLPGGFKKHSGIFNCCLHNCEVGNDVYVDKIQNYIANYKIDDGAYIENVNLILTTEGSKFGNGVKVASMIESGGREVYIFDRLSASIAYMMSFYRYNLLLIEQLKKSILMYADKQKSEKGTIGKFARIVNCGSLTNVRVGDFSDLNGASLLENGTIISNKFAPVIIGNNVQCTDFIIQSGTSINDAALISKCFVGQGCQIGKQFSAIDSLFFANCQALHGEAVSIFAGPYTVTHHKSTLMLTALYSFMNAGSGTNFSNHMYKLGPVHQGITERGVKTSSNSYIMWPAKIGAFTVVLGRHKGNSDISDLPFSYLIENESESHLLPGINLHSSGTVRDVQKWPKRDMRTDPDKLDQICFDFLSPYTISKILRGIDILNGLLQEMDSTTGFVWYQNCKLKRSSIRKGIELYEMAVEIFIGTSIQNKLKTNLNNSNEKKSEFVSDTGIGEWIDMAGLMCPKSEIEKLINRIVLEEIDIDAIQSELNSLFLNYETFSWNFAKDLIEKRTGKSFHELDSQSIDLLLENAKNAEKSFKDMILRDAKKEFNSISKTGYGLDGNEDDRNQDFNVTRGLFDEHPFIKEINKK